MKVIPFLLKKIISSDVHILNIYVHIRNIQKLLGHQDKYSSLFICFFDATCGKVALVLRGRCSCLSQEPEADSCLLTIRAIREGVKIRGPSSVSLDSVCSAISDSQSPPTTMIRISARRCCCHIDVCHFWHFWQFRRPHPPGYQ